MALCAIDLNDAAIVGVGPDGLLLADPGYVPGCAAVPDPDEPVRPCTWTTAPP